MTPREQYYSTPLGSVVGARLWLLNYPEHVGILVPDGFGHLAVISFTRKGIIRQPVEEFANGTYFTSVRYLGSLPWQTVASRAENAVVRQPYHLTNLNCDHFVRHCHGVKQESPQVAVGMMLATIAVLGAAMATSD